MENKILVSISCLTYNHEPYIRQCLDGFLMQKCDFNFEVLIHDGASTDKTQNIIKEYQKKYPNIIKPYIQKENQYSKGIRGMNQRFNFPRAKGKYIAMCEGDDYWTDPLKLQRQVIFLEKNEDYSLSAENSKVIDEINHSNWMFSKCMVDHEYQIKDLLKARKFHTASIVFRKDALSLPKNSSDFPIGDTIIFISLARQGKVHYSPEVSSIYRLHNNGVTRIKNRLKWAKTIEKFNLLLNEFLDYKYSSILYENIYKHYKVALVWAIHEKRIKDSFTATIKFIYYKNLNIIYNHRDS